LTTIAKTADDSQAEPAYGQCGTMADEYRFVAKDGGYATPWRLVPKDGIVGEIRKLKNDQRKRLGEGYSLQLRGPSVRAAIASAHYEKKT